MTAVVLVTLVAAFALAIAQNEKLDWGVFWQNLTAADVMAGLVVTIQLTVVSMTAGILLGMLLAVARLSTNRVLQSLSAAYVWFFRGVPLLVQILVWGNFALLFPRLGIGIPFTDIMFVSVGTNVVLTSFVASCVALALHEAAYMAEVVRGGILGVDSGQSEAASALGMTNRQSMRRIVLPQAMRIILPPTGNQLITLFKSSSLVTVIAGQDLMTVVTGIGATTYRVMESLFVGTFWYLVIVSVLMIGQRFLEKRAGRGQRR
ncbi:amino acid ABC transporter permease [Microbacterium caowuchunii]|uniref:amino acid ABC transporter permease n=1 Tax=Microbacterium caowuchunii TaxID=2614638 RepID=UPI0017860192|nr:amino acid ABC transporter permease [Microbacterium caowuchunii]